MHCSIAIVITGFKKRTDKMGVRKTIFRLAAIAALSLNSFANCDQITLKNGDILQGTLITRTEAFVIWESNNFGTVHIPIDKLLPSNQLAKPTAVITGDNKIVPFKGSIGLSGSYLGGNEERDDLELDILLTLEQGDLTHNTELNYETLGQENEPTIKDYGITYGIDWAMGDNWYWGNNIFYGADDKRQIDQSVSVGTNLGYQFWKNDSGKLSTEIGLAWINEKLFSAINDKRFALVWSGNYQKQVNNKVSLTYSHQLNVSMQDSDNTQLSADIGFIIPVTDKLDTKISWDWSIDNKPEQGNEKIDRKLKFGADYSF